MAHIEETHSGSNGCVIKDTFHFAPSLGERQQVKSVAFLYSYLSAGA